jgi:hypothetical protein
MQGVTGENRKTTPPTGVESLKVNVNWRFILQPFKINELNAKRSITKKKHSMMNSRGCL